MVQREPEGASEAARLYIHFQSLTWMRAPPPFIYYHLDAKESPLSQVVQYLRKPRNTADTSRTTIWCFSCPLLCLRVMSRSHGCPFPGVSKMRAHKEAALPYHRSLISNPGCVAPAPVLQVLLIRPGCPAYSCWRRLQPATMLPKECGSGRSSCCLSPQPPPPGCSHLLQRFPLLTRDRAAMPRPQ